MVREAITPGTLERLDAREAAAWFVVRRAEGLTEAEDQVFRAWLERDASHQKLLDGADRAWRCFDNSDDDEILGAMRAHARSTRGGAGTRWKPVTAIAASLLLVTVAVLIWRVSNPDVRNTARIDPVTRSYATKIGEVREVTLADGTVMTLDADSLAEVRSNGSERGVELQRGRALFAVRPDALHPFVVSVREETIVVSGTRFDVNMLADGLTVTLIEGKIGISSHAAPGSMRNLQPGQQWVLRGGSSSIRSIGQAAGNVSSWTEGLVNFDDQPLSDAIQVMNRYSAEHIVINEPAVRALKVSGQFRAGENRRFADSLAALHRLEVVQTSAGLELIRP